MRWAWHPRAPGVDSSLWLLPRGSQGHRLRPIAGHRFQAPPRHRSLLALPVLLGARDWPSYFGGWPCAVVTFPPALTAFLSCRPEASLGVLSSLASGLCSHSDKRRSPAIQSCAIARSVLKPFYVKMSMN